MTFHYAPQPNFRFNADANIGHAFGFRRRLTRALVMPRKVVCLHCSLRSSLRW